MRRAIKASFKYRWYVPAVLIAMLAVLAFHKPEHIEKRFSEMRKERKIQHVEKQGERKHAPAKMGWDPALESEFK